MSQVKVSGSASGTGTLNIAAPVTNTNQTLTLPDATGTFVVGSAGASAVGQIPFSTDGSTYTPTAKIVSGTAQASTSGTSIDFTSIPSWVKRVTVMFSGVSTSGTNAMLVQIGSGSITSSGYLGSATGYTGVNFSSGFSDGSSNAAAVRHGAYVLTNISSNTWIAQGVIGSSNVAANAVIGGSVTLSGTLDRVRITTVNGTDTFDAGSINILYE